MRSEIRDISHTSRLPLPTWRLPLVFGSLLLPFAQVFLSANNAQATYRQYVIAKANPVKSNQNTRDDPSANGSKSSFDPFGNLRKDMGKLPQILLPEGYAINGRNAILLKHPREYRWFLKFKSSIIPVTHSEKGSYSSNQQPLGTTESSNNSKHSKKQTPDSKSIPYNALHTKTQRQRSEKAKSTPKQISPLQSKLDPFAVPFEVLPCQWLTKMTSVSGDLENISINFRVWAEVTTYHKRNYILPKDVYVLSLFGKAAPKAESKAGGGLSRMDSLQPGGILSGKSGKAKDAERLDQNDLEQSEMIDTLRNILLLMPRAQPLTLTEDDSQDDYQVHEKQISTPSAIRKPLQDNKNIGTADQTSDGQGDLSRGRGFFSLGGKTRSDLKEGTMIVDRVGRLVYDPDEQMWLFTFESDASHLTEAPIVLLPCQLLEVMEKTAYQSARRVKYRISGRVTKYQNRNYLLLRKVLLVFERGNIGK